MGATGKNTNEEDENAEGGQIFHVASLPEPYLYRSSLAPFRYDTQSLVARTAIVVDIDDMRQKRKIVTCVDWGADERQNLSLTGRGWTLSAASRSNELSVCTLCGTTAGIAQDNLGDPDQSFSTAGT